MKDFISRNWMKMLRIGGYVGVVLILVTKYTAEKTLIEDYAKYGKEITANSESLGVGSSIANSFMTKFTSVDENLVKFTILFIVAISIVVFLNTLLDRKKDTKKK